MAKNPHVCDFCGAHTLVESREDETFIYGAGDDEVTLTVNVPVWTCAECDLSFTGDEAEMLRHEAVCAHLGRLRPREIKAIRESYSLTQEQFADVTGFGVASVKRWESAYQIPNLSVDRYLRLLRIPQNFYVLRIMCTEGVMGSPVFRTPLSDRTLQDAKSFRLRSAPRFDLVH